MKVLKNNQTGGKSARVVADREDPVARLCKPMSGKNQKTVKEDFPRPRPECQLEKEDKYAPRGSTGKQLAKTAAVRLGGGSSEDKMG